jgi:hypothetical protein
MEDNDKPFGFEVAWKPKLRPSLDDSVDEEEAFTKRKLTPPPKKKAKPSKKEPVFSPSEGGVENQTRDIPQEAIAENQARIAIVYAPFIYDSERNLSDALKNLRIAWVGVERFGHMNLKEMKSLYSRHKREIKNFAREYCPDVLKELEAKEQKDREAHLHY